MADFEMRDREIKIAEGVKPEELAKKLDLSTRQIESALAAITSLDPSSDKRYEWMNNLNALDTEQLRGRLLSHLPAIEGASVAPIAPGAGKKTSSLDRAGYALWMFVKWVMMK